MEKQPLLVIVGPTASGKTSLAIELAKIYNGEVVSADSMQIYKGLDIATAKPTLEEMQEIPHHLISFVGQEDSFSVADYVSVAKQKIFEISKKGKLPVLAGGTGLYINSLIDNISFDDTQADYQIREKLSEQARLYGNKFLLDKLNAVDPETADTLHENNITRIIRALEVYELTGIKISEQKIKSRLEESPFEPCIIGLNYSDRKILYQRINIRVDEMFKNGLLEEVYNVYSSNNLKTAYQAIGYKELLPYFENKATLEECKDKLKQQTRRYAKRQLTWFRRDSRIDWIVLDSIKPQKENIIKNAKNIIENSKLL